MSPVAAKFDIVTTSNYNYLLTISNFAGDIIIDILYYYYCTRGRAYLVIVIDIEPDHCTSCHYIS